MLSCSSPPGSPDTQFNTSGRKEQAKSLYSMRVLHISFIHTCLLSIYCVLGTEDLVVHKTEELIFMWDGETRINAKTPNSYNAMKKNMEK